MKTLKVIIKLQIVKLTRLLQILNLRKRLQMILAVWRLNSVEKLIRKEKLQKNPLPTMLEIQVNQSLVGLDLGHGNTLQKILTVKNLEHYVTGVPNLMLLIVI